MLLPPPNPFSWFNKLLFENFILPFFDNAFIPILSKVLGQTAVDLFKKIIEFVKGTVKWTRLQIRQAWTWLQTHILGIKMVYKRLSSIKFVRETTAYFLTEEGKVVESVQTSEVDWYDAPSDVRDKIVKNTNTKTSFQIDAKELLEKEFKARVKEQENISDNEVLELLDLKIQK